MPDSINISGRWHVRERFIKDGNRKGSRIEYGVTVIQEGQNTKIKMEDKETSPSLISGSLKGNTLKLSSYTYQEEEGGNTVTDSRVEFGRDREILRNASRLRKKPCCQEDKMLIP